MNLEENYYGDEFEHADYIQNEYDLYDKYSNDDNIYDRDDTKFIKLTHFEIIEDKIADLGPGYDEDNQEETLLALLNHPYGDSKCLDQAYFSLQQALNEEHTTQMQTAMEKAKEAFQTGIEFQLESRQPACPVCLEEEFQTCTHFYRCETCKGGVCADCGTLITNKCPMCNVKQQMCHITLDKLVKREMKTVGPKRSVADLLTEIMYRSCPESTEKVNIFGQDIRGYEHRHMSGTTPEQFDYELAELLRLSRDLLFSWQEAMDAESYREKVATDLWWCQQLEPYLMGN